MNIDKQKYYCVWDELDKIICLTSDYGDAVDSYAQYMDEIGNHDTDSWVDSPARIEEFSEFPQERKDIMDYLTDVEIASWKRGDTMIL